MFKKSDISYVRPSQSRGSSSSILQSRERELSLGGTSDSQSLFLMVLKQCAAVRTCLDVMRTPPQKLETFRVRLEVQTSEAMKGNWPSFASCPPKTKLTLPSSPQRPFSTVLMLTSFVDGDSRTGLSSVAQSGQHVREPQVVSSVGPHIGGKEPLQLCSS